MPPRAAIETAIEASVTVSIGEATHGRERRMLRERRVERSTESAGKSM